MAEAAENELNFLPLVHDIIKSIEKDSLDVNQKMTDFRNQLLKAREVIEKLPGTQYSRDDQLKQIDILKQQLANKTELLQKYKNLTVFDI
ncbi:hypothetical protein ACJMK2_034711 [Sinanodonta woodiana]|uniref:Mediator of RNA polymerase II transcription subunit 9 n=1 Tax=Sinanodonta woodiana TaxID=1069815 RepID=A0ABD3WTX8_SINWO